MKRKALLIVALCTFAFPTAGVASRAPRSIRSPSSRGRIGPTIPNAEGVATPIQFGLDGPVVAGGL